MQALRDEGVPPAALARLRSPIGLDLGAVTPEEVAVSVVSELVAVRYGRSVAAPLSVTDGPLHLTPDDASPCHSADDKELSRWT
jgi:xanthine dehydrogenase accessory factor